MKNGIAARQHSGKGRWITQITLHEQGTRRQIGLRSGRKIVEDYDIPTGGAEAIRQMRADKTSAAHNECLHSGEATNCDTSSLRPSISMTEQMDFTFLALPRRESVISISAGGSPPK